MNFVHDISNLIYFCRDIIKQSSHIISNSNKTNTFSDISIEDSSSHPSKWPTPRIKLLIRLRLEMESQFRTGKSKHVLWTKVYNKMKAQDPSMPLTLNNIQKKYSNLLLSYKRIKRTSRNQTPKWEFFEDFDAILSLVLDDNGDDDDQNKIPHIKVEQFGDDSVSFSSDDFDARPVYSEFLDLSQETTNKSTTSDVQIANGNKSPANVEIIQETKKRKFTETDCHTDRKKFKECAEPEDDNKWFKEYVKLSERREQIRHEKLMQMEKRKLEIETQKVQMFRELLDVMKKFVNK